MGYKLSFAYDNRGNLTDIVDRDNGTTHYVYDDDSRMTSVTNPFDETTGYEYSLGGRVEKRLLANGCVTYYGYDEAGQVNLVDNRAPDLSVISSFAYERDSRGNPTRITREDGSVVEYGYDAKSQLTSEVHKDPQGATTDAWEWNYDLSGNRLYQIHNDVQTDYAYNLANQLAEETTGTDTTYYAYDRCGNTKTKQEPAGTTHYHWDPENRLTQIDQPGNVHSYFSYDADGKRVTKQDAEGFTRFIYQGPDMLKLMQERDEEGNVTAHYTIGDGLESMRRGADSRFYHYDWLGSTFELTDGNGAVTDSYLYDAWGNALATTGATPNPHRYVGKLRYYEMPGTGLYHVGHRQLHTAVGRFLVVDPAKDGSNWYDYVGNHLTVYVDPLGLQNIEEVEEVLEAISPETAQRVADLVNRIPVEKIEAGWKASLPYIIGAGVAVEELIRRNWHRLCRVRHPGWDKCGKYKTPEAAAADPNQSDRGPGHPKGKKLNLPNPLKWVAVQPVPPCQADGPMQHYLPRDLWSQLYICPVRYRRIAQPHDLRKVTQSVAWEQCCHLWADGSHCYRIHYHGDLSPDLGHKDIF